jgi:putative spermidine/putrescine transport system ATP-binding protein
MAEAKMEDLHVIGLRRRVGEFELRADFRVRAGERLAVLGRSGGGKTSLLRTLAGLDSARDWDGGSIRLGDTELSRLPAEKRAVGYVFQETSLFPQLNVLENAAFGLRMRGVLERERAAQVRPWLAKVGLAELAEASVARLSGGERSRIAFVRALVWKPRLILLDEPFTALDPDRRDSLRKTLLELHALWPAPMLLVSHDEEDARAVATARMRLEESAEGSIRQFRRADS